MNSHSMQIYKQKQKVLVQYVITEVQQHVIELDKHLSEKPFFIHNHQDIIVNTARRFMLSYLHAQFASDVNPRGLFALTAYKSNSIRLFTNKAYNKSKSMFEHKRPTYLNRNDRKKEQNKCKI